jgi:hypothetical protein
VKPQPNHTIVKAHDHEASATFLCEVMGFDPPVTIGHFQVVESGNGVSLDYAEAQGEISGQHYAFVVIEAEFDEIFARVVERELPY